MPEIVSPTLEQGFRRALETARGPRGGALHATVTREGFEAAITQRLKGSLFATGLASRRWSGRWELGARIGVTW